MSRVRPRNRLETRRIRWRIVIGRAPLRRLSGVLLNSPDALYRIAALTQRASRYKKSAGSCWSLKRLRTSLKYSRSRPIWSFHRHVYRSAISSGRFMISPHNWISGECASLIQKRSALRRAATAMDSAAEPANGSTKRIGWPGNGAESWGQSSACFPDKGSVVVMRSSRSSGCSFSHAPQTRTQVATRFASASPPSP